MPRYFNNGKIIEITNHTFRPYKKNFVISIDDKNLTPTPDYNN